MSSLTAWLHCLDSGDTASATAKNLTDALAKAGITSSAPEQEASRGYHLVICDTPDDEVCRFVNLTSRHGHERLLVLALSREDVTTGTAWRLLAAGASDVLVWNDVPDPAAQVCARLGRWHAVDEIVRSPLVRENLIGESPVWITFLRKVVEVARFTDASILLTGETGTGKELTARLIHTLDARPQKKDLVVLDCTTIVPELSGSEFFGHERGAFTGAVSDRQGAFALADGGTLFLDEVGELPLDLQGKLLRVIQEHTYKRVGGNTWHRSEFRLVCASNRDLSKAVARGEFRSDLYHRMAVFVFRLPPLRDRPEDVLALATHFLKRQMSNGEPELDQWLSEYLVEREYPGNVRDLEQLVCRIAQCHTGPGPLSVGEVPQDDRPGVDFRPREWRNAGFERAISRALARGVPLKEIGRGATDLAVQIAIDQAEGNLQRAARTLGVTDRALQMRRAARVGQAEQPATG